MIISGQTHLCVGPDAGTLWAVVGLTGGHAVQKHPALHCSALLCTACPLSVPKLHLFLFLFLYHLHLFVVLKKQGPVFCTHLGVQPVLSN